MKKEKDQPTAKDWAKVIIVILLYLAFLYWLGSWWGLIVVPFIFDAYITHIIPWTWWKEVENPIVRTVMSWVDAIVFALVAVYFVNIYFFQNYTIPSSSLEPACGRLSVCKQDELRSPRTADTASHAPVPAYATRGWKELSGMD